MGQRRGTSNVFSVLRADDQQPLTSVAVKTTFKNEGERKIIVDVQTLELFRSEPSSQGLEGSGLSRVCV